LVAPGVGPGVVGTGVVVGSVVVGGPAVAASMAFLKAV
jgi:hypothetical protein